MYLLIHTHILLFSEESSPGPSGEKYGLKYINRKGGTVLLYAGYQFTKKCTYKSGAIVWECHLRKKTKCTGTITIRQNQILKETSHSCTPDFDKNLLECYMDKCKKKIVSSYEPAISDFNAKYHKILKKLEKLEGE
ncbi:hypothetical protein PYW07_016451 [Mythimna separata]|uniref:FLYWCH-type domain-containing protein n=1 Tax=Mythimna separata TaxID=271217 RepID=A0AAD8DSS1_MYTSE|nr:hypothetical protein PYW07_016451 [Mythimna separata]